MKTDLPTLELIGRESELRQIRACLRAGRNVLLEGPVGVGKTHLAISVIRDLGRLALRVDGDSRYSEQKLAGWFDPPSVIQKGFTAETFVPGPLVEAMRSGGILFINELNRLPEGVQNILLPAIDEGMILVPRLGEIRAQPGFGVIATQNPKEFVATSHLSEAILDRFDLVRVDYQGEADEVEIVSRRIAGLAAQKKIEARLSLAAVRLARATRVHPRVRRGASVRAALGVAELTLSLLKDGISFEEAFVSAALMALPTRIEIEHELEGDGSAQEELEALLREWSEAALANLSPVDDSVKKKS